jgi:acetyl-CoA C-acetyltransferase
MASRSVVIAEPVRTAIGAFGGSLKDVLEPDLGAVAIRAAIERAGLNPKEIERAAMGNIERIPAPRPPAGSSQMRR